jgi:hypothetical protein
MQVRDQLHAVTAVPSGKNLWYILVVRLGRQQNQFGYSGKGMNPFLC